MHPAAYRFVEGVLFDQSGRDLIASMFAPGGSWAMDTKLVDARATAMPRAYPPLAPRHLVVELGSLIINGSVRELFKPARYLGIDRQWGPGVDVVADAANYEPPFEPDTVVCCEMLEHAENAQAALANAYRMLAPGGAFILTCATEPRMPHSAIDGHMLGAQECEFYRNVLPDELLGWLAPFASVIVSEAPPGDLYAVAFK